MKKAFSAIIIFALTAVAAAGLAGCNPSYQKRTEYVFSDSGLSLSVMAMGGNFDKAFDEMLAALEIIDRETNINHEIEKDSLSAAGNGAYATNLGNLSSSSGADWQNSSEINNGIVASNSVIKNSNLDPDGYGHNVINRTSQSVGEFNSDAKTNAGDQSVLRLNLAGAGEQVEIGFYTFDMIRLAKQAYKQTNGAFNIAAYPLVYLWGIDALGYEDSEEDYLRGLSYDKWRTPQSFAGSDIKRTLPLPDYDEVQRVKEFCDLDKLKVFERDGRYFAEKENAALMIDLGGISKGYAADLCAEICRQNGITSALIDISGNNIFVGDYVEKGKSGDWKIGITNAEGGIFCAYNAKANTTAVTSGDYERFRRAKSGGKYIEICHIIDTATGLPYGLGFDGEHYYTKQDRVVSVSVLSGSSALSDAYTTAACVMGFDKSMSFFAENHIDAIIVTSDKRYAVTGDVEFVLTDKYDIFKSFTRVYQD